MDAFDVEQFFSVERLSSMVSIFLSPFVNPNLLQPTQMHSSSATLGISQKDQLSYVKICWWGTYEHLH